MKIDVKDNNLKLEIHYSDTSKFRSKIYDVKARLSQKGNTPASITNIAIEVVSYLAVPTLEQTEVIKSAEKNISEVWLRSGCLPPKVSVEFKMLGGRNLG